MHKWFDVPFVLRTSVQYCFVIVAMNGFSSLFVRLSGKDCDGCCRRCIFCRAAFFSSRRFESEPAENGMGRGREWRLSGGRGGGEQRALGVGGAGGKNNYGGALTQHLSQNGPRSIQAGSQVPKEPQ